ncbi:MAG: peptide-methionine (S)-S-oxide reductase, partial [Shewanella sp.]
MTLATFGAGCFWGVEYVFRRVDGVINATCGYMGGNNAATTYQEVKQGHTGHAEVVQVEF